MFVRKVNWKRVETREKHNGALQKTNVPALGRHFTTTVCALQKLQKWMKKCVLDTRSFVNVILAKKRSTHLGIW
jgi:hypothetical protein